MIVRWEQDTTQGVTYPLGFKASAVRAGLKSEGDDLALIACDDTANVAAVFTTNRVVASSVKLSRRAAAKGSARAVICNAGNANACNGLAGDEDAVRMAQLTAGGLSAGIDDILVAQTGIIGVPMPMQKVEDAVPRAVATLGSGRETDQSVARAIMTTDLVPKSIAAECLAESWVAPIRFGGVCKGSGMIAPNMATMLCFLTTDASVPASLLQPALAHAVDRTFNRMTVDGDTSTNDMVVLMASGKGAGVITTEGPALDAFRIALERVCRHLAREVARDGEGATKLVDVVVSGARAEADAVKVARTIAESPLVKTALYGCDPNWGRLLMAAGRAGVDFDMDLVEAQIGPYTVCRNGQSVPFDVDGASSYLKSKEVTLKVDLHSGGAEATFWTCDYSYDYIKINADYHT
jgi:glutamate N-acetyltransferase / amino-acid N-acetyltransferase